MKKFVFYTYDFKPGSGQKDCFQGNEQPELTEEQKQEWFERLFGAERTTFIVKQNNRGGADEFPCYVMSHRKGIVLLRLEHKKIVNLYVKQPAVGNNLPRIDREPRSSHPYIYVIIDLRPERKLIAISIDTDAWSNTDTVGNLLRESINRQLEELSLGFNIELKAVKLHRDFVEYSRYLIKTKRRRVTKMTFYFSGGTINPELEEIIKKDQYLSGLNNRRFKAPHCEISYIDPDSASIVRKNSRTLEHFVTLVMSDPQSEAFRLRMTYDDGTTLFCGKDTRFEYDMNDDTFMSMMGEGTFFPEYDIFAWLDEVVTKIEEEYNEKTAYQKGEAEVA